MKLITLLGLILTISNAHSFFIIQDDIASDPYETVTELGNNQFSVASNVETRVIGTNGCWKAEFRAKRFGKDFCKERFTKCEEISSGIKSSYRAAPADENFFLSYDPGHCKYEVKYQGTLPIDEELPIAENANDDDYDISTLF